MMKHSKQFLIIGSILAGLGVALGAVGSHSLRNLLLENNRAETFETAVRYQLYHGAALMMIGILCYVFKEISFVLTGWLILVGVICFSGSLYLHSLFELRSVIYITPIGGILMIGGWVSLVVQLVRSLK